MPIKRRSTKRRYQVNFEVTKASIDGGAWERLWGGPKEGRLAWEALRDQLRDHLGTRSAPFWLYEPDVPAHLRCLASPYAPYEDPAIEEQGLQWLLGSNHLREGESAEIVRKLESLPPMAERIAAVEAFQRDFVEPVGEEK